MIRTFGLVAALTFSALPLAAQAKTVEANCSGMFDLDNYKFDTEAAEQDIPGIGKGAFEMTETEIIMTGSFGEYRFELKGGKLYKDGRDSGIHCTYQGLK